MSDIESDIGSRASSNRESSSEEDSDEVITSPDTLTFSEVDIKFSEIEDQFLTKYIGYVWN